MFSYKSANVLLGTFILAMLSACASTPQTTQILQAPPTQIRPKANLEQVAFFPQKKYQCGPAALATVLDYQGKKIAIEELTRRVYIPKRKGSLQTEMVATARSYGLLSYKIKPDLESLLKEINAGNPVLVFQNLSLEIFPQWHYAVVAGYDLDKAELTLRSGTTRNYKINFSTFERTWQRAGYWAYVFLQPGEIPFTAIPYLYTQASLELQKSGMTTNALKAFRQGVKKWPDNSIVLMASGNAEYAAGHFDQAITAFQSELKLRALNANAWNNLAYSLSAKSCNAAALEAVLCANKINPDDKNIQQSILQIKAVIGTDTKSCHTLPCPVK